MTEESFAYKRSSKGAVNPGFLMPVKAKGSDRFGGTVLRGENYPGARLADSDTSHNPTFRVREACSFGEDVAGLVPPNVSKRL